VLIGERQSGNRLEALDRNSRTGIGLKGWQKVGLGVLLAFIPDAVLLKVFVLVVLAYLFSLLTLEGGEL